MSGFLLWVGVDGRVVDPGDGGKFGWGGSPSAEPAGVGGVGGVEGLDPSGADLGGGAVVDRCRGVQADAGVAVLMVVVVEELGAEGSGVFDGPEAGGERRAVLEGFVDRFAVGVVVADMRSGVGAPDAEIGEELGDALGGHRRAPIGVDGQACRLVTPWAATAAEMNSSASSAVSVAATIQPTT